MAYRFKRKEDVDVGVCRIAAERLERAISRLKRSRNPLGEAVHEVRMDIKKLRALLRLVRQAIGKKAFRREAATLREAAACLAAVRDARMKVQTVQRLIKQSDGKVPRDSFPKIADKLQRNCDQQSHAFAQNRSADKVLACLRKMESRIGDWRVDEDGWAALEPGLLASYRQGRRDFLLVQQQPAARNFHEWRKRVKDLGYQLRLLRSAWPRLLCATIDAVDELGEHLGDDHDATVLCDALYELGFDKRENEFELLTSLIEQRQRELRARALVLGERIYAEKPRQFRKRICSYWRRWRRRR